MLAHGAALRNNGFSAEQLTAIARDFRQAGLDPAEVAMMEYAQRVIRDPRRITQEQIDGLRAHGFSDEEILDITLTASARSFFSKTLDALGVEPDAAYLGLEPELRAALTIGRPFAP